jgi:uncharacterized SAM-binding protein YcdF (DUF218 family)
MVTDPLQHANAVVVLGGQVPFRAMEAAEIYRGGWAPEVWLTQGGVYEEDVALAKLGIATMAEYQYSRLVLERVGVPPSAIRVLDGHNFSTADEVRTISRQLHASGGGRVIVVTSKFHSRRVRATWRRIVGGSPDVVVRYTNEDPFKPDNWWRNTRDGMSVARELFGLLNLWTGFPVQSGR